MPSPSLRRHAPHRITSMCKPLSYWKTLVGLAALCTGWRALPGLQACSACWGLGQVLPHLTRSPVFFYSEAMCVPSENELPNLASAAEGARRQGVDLVHAAVCGRCPDLKDVPVGNGQVATP